MISVSNAGRKFCLCMCIVSFNWEHNPYLELCCILMGEPELANILINQHMQVKAWYDVLL
jgi:hypothetical protein